MISPKRSFSSCGSSLICSNGIPSTHSVTSTRRRDSRVITSGT
jgi:hypothetical protein